MKFISSYIRISPASTKFLALSYLDLVYKILNSQVVTGAMDFLSSLFARKRIYFGGYGSPSTDSGNKENRLNALPESLLLHILSFLDMKDVARTSVLSKNWQFLWMNLSMLNFRYDGYNIVEICCFVDWVTKTLVKCSGTYLNKFEVRFRYKDHFASVVKIWVQSLIKYKVKDVALNFHSTVRNYELPEMMYSNSSLTNLSLRNCTISPMGKIEWKSLTSLSIGETILSQDVMEIILSGCPVLEFLKLEKCSGLGFLDINTRSLKELVIENWRHHKTHLLEIRAPYLLRLSITGFSLRFNCRGFQLINISSLSRANLGFDKSHRLAYYSGDRGEQMKDYMKELFRCLQDVEELVLGAWFVEVLPVLVMGGWMGGWQLPQYSCKCLTIDAFIFMWSIPGILCMLESSPNLETLVINKNAIKEDKVSRNNSPASYLEKNDLNCDLLHLKTIKIVSPGGPFLTSEPMLKLLQQLLNRAKVLEKMVINVKSSRITSIDYKMLQALNSFPRSSTKAVIIFSC